MCVCVLGKCLGGWVHACLEKSLKVDNTRHIMHNIESSS